MSPSVWPFVGRTDESAALRAALEQTAGAVLRGPAGVGKTTLARQVLEDRLCGRDNNDRGAALHWCVASPSTAAVPYAAVADLLLSIDVDVDPNDATNVLLAARRVVAADTRRHVLFIDDAPLLDPASVVLVCQLLRDGDVTVVATARDGQTLADELGRFVDDRTLAEITVGALSTQECSDILEHVLGGPVADDAVGVLWSRSQGNALFLRELLVAAEAAGVLAWQRGEWRLVGELAVPDRLVDIVSRRVAAVTGPARTALAATAVGEPLPVSVAASLTSPDMVALLEEQRLIEMVAGARLRVAHPLLGEAVRAGLGSAERREIVARLAHELDADGAGMDDHDVLLRWALARLDAEVPVPTATLAKAAQVAFGLLQHDLAVRLAVAALGGDPTDGSAATDLGRGGDAFESMLVLGAARSALLDVDGATQALEAAVGRAASDGQRARSLGRYGLHLCIRAGRVEDGVKVLEEGLDSVTDPEWRAFVEADLAKVHLAAGRAPTMGHRHRDDVVAIANEAIAVGLLSAMAGATEQALQAADTGLALVDEVRGTLPNLHDLLHLARYLALSFAGRAEEAGELAAAELAATEHGRGEPRGMWLAMTAATALHCGDPGEAERRATAAGPHLQRFDFVGGLAAQSHAVHAAAAAQRGEVGRAEQLLDQIDPAWLNDAKVHLHVELAAAWLAAAAGRRDDAAARVVRAGEFALAGGLPLLGALVAHDAVRFGHADLAAPLLGSIAAAAPTSIAVVLAASADAAAADDPRAIVTAAEELVAAGAPGRAAALYADAARRFRRRGSKTEATTAEANAQALTAPGVETVAVAPLLAPREREVAALAAARWPNREIADHLGVSVRTVENTLVKVYRKLGIVRRGELAAALAAAGLASPPE